MNDFDITVALTAHSETVVSGPTMRSVENAIRAAEAVGYRVERLIGLDAPSSECRLFFTQPAFANWTIKEFDFANPSLNRNALVNIASGRWIAFSDADDLFSENWIVSGAQLLANAERHKEKIIVHPEVVWVFDGGEFVFCRPAQDDLLFTPHFFYFTSYYDTIAMTPREAHLSFPYAPVDIAGGFGNEDRQWNIETAGAGWKHVVAKDTILLNRRRDMSIFVQNMNRRTLIYDLECMAIDSIANLNRMIIGLGTK